MFDASTYDPVLEYNGQCISIAKIKLTDLDKPQGRAKRWDGKAFNVPYDGIGTPVKSFANTPG